MSELAKLAEILKEQAAFRRPRGDVWTQTKHVAEVAKAHGVSAAAVSNAPGKTVEEVAGRLGAERAKGLTAERAQQLGGSPSLARLHPDVRGVVRGVAQPQALPGRDPGSVAQAAHSRAEGARRALRESVSLNVRAAPTVTATEKVSPQLAAASGREQARNFVPSAQDVQKELNFRRGRPAPVKFEARQQRQEAEAVVRGKDVSRELGHDRSREIAQNVDTLRGQQTLEMVTTKPSKRPDWVLPSKHEVRRELAAKYDKPKEAPTSSIDKIRHELEAKHGLPASKPEQRAPWSEVNETRQALRTHLRGKEILAKKTIGVAPVAGSAEEAAAARRLAGSAPEPTFEGVRQKKTRDSLRAAKEHVRAATGAPELSPAERLARGNERVSAKAHAKLVARAEAAKNAPKPLAERASGAALDVNLKAHKAVGDATAAVSGAAAKAVEKGKALAGAASSAVVGKIEKIKASRSARATEEAAHMNDMANDRTLAAAKASKPAEVKKQDRVSHEPSRATAGTTPWGTIAAVGGGSLVAANALSRRDDD